MNKCNLCPRRCNAERTENTNIGGFCKMPSLPRIAKACLHFWEEPCISGKDGSGTVFFSGCSLRCVFCQNYKLSHDGYGKTISYQRLAEIFRELEEKGANNINLVNPTHYVDAIKKALEIYTPKIPIVYNCGGYDDESVANLDFVDVYLFDLKFYDDEKSLKYAAAKNYFEIAAKVIKKAHDRIGKPEFSKDGIMQKGVIIRHLLLPSATNDAIKIIDWASENCKNTVFSLMSQYLPYGDACKFKELSRRVTDREYEKVVNHLLNKNFYNSYIQERSSSSEEYIPIFDCEGV